MAVGFALVDHVHNLLGAGDEALGAALSTGRGGGCEEGKHEAASTETTGKEERTFTNGTLFLSSWTDKLVFVTWGGERKGLKQCWGDKGGI